MEQSQETLPGTVSTQYSCGHCGRALNPGWMFAIKRSAAPGIDTSDEIISCVWCALRHRPLVRRSLIVAVVVGTIVTLLNQGDTLIHGDWGNDLYWKTPLTYCVPFCVTTYGAISNARR